ncbi:MAG: hypothetical protein AMJ79_07445 [Phycisphaerae bacterium SM23_30]|nr:MAG: hypothetical protein AMJ79_07445 [Phycisphaerae bacterium SM23_30]
MKIKSIHLIVFTLIICGAMTAYAQTCLWWPVNCWELKISMQPCDDYDKTEENGECRWHVNGEQETCETEWADKSPIICL